MSFLPTLLHDLVSAQAQRDGAAIALVHRDRELSYQQLQHDSQALARGLLAQGLNAGDRVAIWLPKTPEAVVSMLAASVAGLIFVPINPALKPAQVGHILRDCGVRVLITAKAREQSAAGELAQCPDLQAVVLVDEAKGAASSPYRRSPWLEFLCFDEQAAGHRRIEGDAAAIFYTSGSTGKPKGVVVSHRNVVAGAHSVASYLNNHAGDRVLAVLPLSFDAGFSQLSTVFLVGGAVILMDYLLPADVWKAVARYQATGLAGVPALWNQLVALSPEPPSLQSLRYITNTGGAMPRATTSKLRSLLPQADIYLMYGLTEAFRSTYLPPDQVALRPESIGKAIPNVELMVVDEQGKPCPPNQAGELVHRGPLVALGYWNAPDKTRARFRPWPGQADELTNTELAVWSGDTVRCDEEGYLYFVARNDAMIKTSGYRVSPTEVEEVVFDSGLVTEAVVLGLPHDMLGQGVLLLAVVAGSVDTQLLLTHCRKQLPNFMVPLAVEVVPSLPRNQNGKIDRPALAQQYESYFQGASHD